MSLQLGIAFKASWIQGHKRSLNGLKDFRCTVKTETGGILISDIQRSQAPPGASVPFPQQCALLSANEMIPHFKHNCS